MERPTEDYIRKINEIREWIGRELHEWASTSKRSPELTGLYVVGSRGFSENIGNDWDVVVGVSGVSSAERKEIETILRVDGSSFIHTSDPVDPVVVPNSEVRNKAFSMARHGGYKTIYNVMEEAFIQVE